MKKLKLKNTRKSHRRNKKGGMKHTFAIIDDRYYLRPIITFFKDVEGNEHPLLRHTTTQPPGNNWKIFQEITKTIQNPHFVGMGEIKFASHDKLFTDGLASCSALALYFGQRKGLAHISPEQNVDPLIDTILAEVGEEKILRAIITRGVIDFEELAEMGYEENDDSYSLVSFEKCIEILKGVKYEGKIEVEKKTCKLI